MYLITSGAYVNQGLEAEFGKIPPTFLPLQNKRLFHHQVRRIPKGTSIFMSLPESFVINDKDEEDLVFYNVNIIRTPDNISLGQSLVYSLNTIGKYEDEVKILHGDTLFSNIDLPNDIFLVSKASDNYKWAWSENQDNSNTVFAGFFSFSNQQQLIYSLTLNNYSFIEGIKSYAGKIDVKYITTDDWFDFGHINTYYTSKSRLTSEREFNSLKIDNQIVKKESKKINKIQAEVNWYKTIPNSLKIYTPQVYNNETENNTAYYEIEYLYKSTLSELYVFGKNELFVWERIIDACREFIEKSFEQKPNKSDFNLTTINKLYSKKTFDRLEEFQVKTGFQIDRKIIINGLIYPSLIEVAKLCSSRIEPARSSNISVIHGDFCFSNILYDFRAKNIKVIDPRGLDYNKRFTIYGDIRYDIAKLAHSIFGCYDLIKSDYFNIEQLGPYNFNFQLCINDNILSIREYFLTLGFFGKSLDELNALHIVVQLFLSMLPLHSDNKKHQMAFLLNALTLYKFIEK